MPQGGGEGGAAFVPQAGADKTRWTSMAFLPRSRLPALGTHTGFMCKETD